MCLLFTALPTNKTRGKHWASTISAKNSTWNRSSMTTNVCVVWWVHYVSSAARQFFVEQNQYLSLLITLKVQYSRILNTCYCCDLRSESPSGMCAKLYTVAASNNRCHSPRTLVITFNRSHVNIGRAYTPRSLYYCLFAPHIYTVLFFTHIPFVVNHTFNATPTERLQQYE